jgi:hypothetical protein
MSIDPRFERLVLSEFALRERRARRRDEAHGARVLAHRVHQGDSDMLEHLRRVADRVPTRFSRVAWLHHADQVDLLRRDLGSVGLTNEETVALGLLAGAGLEPCARSLLDRARALSAAPGWAGHLARVVARASIQDRLNGKPPAGETLAVLHLLPDPRMAACTRSET